MEQQLTSHQYQNNEENTELEWQADPQYSAHKLRSEAPLNEVHSNNQQATHLFTPQSSAHELPNEEPFNEADINNRQAAHQFTPQYSAHELRNEEPSNEADINNRQATHQFTPQYSAHELRNEEPFNEADINNRQAAHQFTPQSKQASDRGTSPYYGVPHIVQVPEYTVEQIMMQENIRQDTHGLLKMRESMKIMISSLLIVVSIILIFNLITIVELSAFGFISGVSIRFFSATELFVVRIVYVGLIAMSGSGVIALVALLKKVNQIRAISISSFEAPLKASMLMLTFGISMSLFFAAFWLMTSPTSYWLFFTLQAVIIFGAYILIFILLKQAEHIFYVTKHNHLPKNDKPQAEIEYYKPIGYKTETRYINQ